jgi:DNA-binding NarL/FixJ family response regulator
MPIRIVIADDHAIVRQGLRVFLSFDSELEVVGEAVNGKQAVEFAHSLRPRCCLDGPGNASDGRR